MSESENKIPAKKPAKQANQQYVALSSVVIDNVQYMPDQLVPYTEHTERLLELEAIKILEA